MPRTARAAAAIICGSEFSRGEIAAAYPVAPEKIHVVPYGIDHEHFRPGAALDADWAQELGLRDGYVLHVGELSQRKNIPRLLRAIALLRSAGKFAGRQLVLAGAAASGMLGATDIHAAIQELELQHVVVLPGRVPQAELPGLYAHASLLVMPSIYEGFGFPVLEAMATGTAVVASDQTSIPEVAADAAVLVSPHDEQALAEAIGLLLQDQRLAAELRKKGLARAAQFTWERAAAVTLDVYRGVVGSLNA